MMLRTFTTTAITLAGVALMVGCGESKSPESKSSATPSPVATAPAPPATTPPPVVPPPPSQSGTDDASGTSKDSAATDPKTLTKTEESKAMPEAGHGNNHSSPALESNAKEAAPKQ
jgi:hypothetical protein